MLKKISILVSLSICFIFVYAQDDMTVLSLNDFHGQMLPHNDMVGAAKIATYVEKYRKNHPNLVVVAAGDNYQGTAISNLSHGQVVNDFFDYIGLHFSAVGNHDFDYGQSWFKNWQQDNKVTFLAANIEQKDDDFMSWISSLFGDDQYEDFKLAKPFGYHTFANGKTLYFIGLSTLETPETTAEKHISNLKFTNPSIAANKWVKYINDYKLHNIPKPSAIVLLTHIPTEQKHDGVIFSSKRPKLGNQSEISYVSENVYGISSILSGHSHQYVNGHINNIAISQGGSQGKDISILHYDCHTTPICVVTSEVINLSSATKDLVGNEHVTKIIDKYYNSMKKVLNTVIAVSPVALSNKTQNGDYNVPLSYTIADIMMKHSGADVALQNTHGIRRSLPKGDITYSMLYETMPFDNMVGTLQIKGSDLLLLIKHSLVPKGGVQLGVMAGVDVVISDSHEIKSVSIGGKPLNINKEYKLATIDFLVTGGDGFDFSNITQYKDTGIPVRDIVKQYWLNNTANISPSWQNVHIRN